MLLLDLFRVRNQARHDQIRIRRHIDIEVCRQAIENPLTLERYLAGLCVRFELSERQSERFRGRRGSDRGVDRGRFGDGFDDLLDC
jgi:hypothetical protein